MLDLSLMFKDISVEKENVISDMSQYTIEFKDAKDFIISEITIHELVKKVNYIFTKKIEPKTIKLIFPALIFGDDAAILYLELIIKYLYEKNVKKIYIYGKDDVGALNSLFANSFITISMNNYSRLINKNKFLKLFGESIFSTAVDSNLGISEQGYQDENQLRLQIKNNGDLEMSSRAATIILEYLLDRRWFNLEYTKSIIHIIGETIDNTMHHSTSDCIICIKTCYIRMGQESKFLLSIVMLNLDEILISTKIKEQLEIMLNGNSQEINQSINNIVYRAYNSNKEKMNDLYNLDFFCMVSAFQRGITTRYGAINNSGKGLTRIMSAILDKTEAEHCYVYSGNNVIRLRKGYLDVSNEGFVGFNKNNDYLNSIPDEEVIEKADYFIKGLLYNLVLIYDRSEINENRDKFKV